MVFMIHKYIALRRFILFFRLDDFNVDIIILYFKTRIIFSKYKMGCCAFCVRTNINRSSINNYITEIDESDDLNGLETSSAFNKSLLSLLKTPTNDHTLNIQNVLKMLRQCLRLQPLNHIWLCLGPNSDGYQYVRQIISNSLDKRLCHVYGNELNSLLQNDTELNTLPGNCLFISADKQHTISAQCLWYICQKGYTIIIWAEHAPYIKPDVAEEFWRIFHTLDFSTISKQDILQSGVILKI